LDRPDDAPCGTLCGSRAHLESPIRPPPNAMVGLRRFPPGKNRCFRLSKGAALLALEFSGLMDPLLNWFRDPGHAAFASLLVSPGALILSWLAFHTSRKTQERQLCRRNPQSFLSFALFPSAHRHAAIVSSLPIPRKNFLPQNNSPVHFHPRP